MYAKSMVGNAAGGLQRTPLVDGTSQQMKATTLPAPRSVRLGNDTRNDEQIPQVGRESRN